MNEDRRDSPGSGSPELEPVLDPERLEALRRLEAASGEAVLTQILDSFRDHSDQLLATLEEASAQGDPEGLALASHSLAGSAAALGGRRLSAACRDFESAARRSDLAVCRRALPQVAAERRRLLDLLSSQIRD